MSAVPRVGGAVPRVAIMVMTRNEEATVREILDRIRAVDPAYELGVVDGHSHDRTAEIASEAGARVIRDRGLGKGDGTRTAIESTDAEILVFIDADGSHDPADIPRLIEPILAGRADHVTASRMLGGSDELFGSLEGVIKVLGTGIITLGINYRFGVHLTDSQSGFRAIRRSVASQLGLKENITTIEQEMIIKTLRKGFRMAEVPTHEYARKAGNSVIVLRKVFVRYLYSWLRYLFFD